MKTIRIWYNRALVKVCINLTRTAIYLGWLGIAQRLFIDAVRVKMRLILLGVSV